MGKIAIALLLLAVGSAAADTPAFICTNANGSKSIQDEPCDVSAGQRLDERRTAQKNRSPPPKRGANKIKMKSASISCNAMFILDK